MARNKADQQNIDASDLANYPNKRIQDNTGANNGTPVNEALYGDKHEFFDKLMRDAKIAFNGRPDNVTNGYQYIDALFATAGKNDIRYGISVQNATTLRIPQIDLSTLKVGEIIECHTAGPFGTGKITINGKNGSTKTISEIDPNLSSVHLILLNGETVGNGGSVAIMQKIFPYNLPDVAAIKKIYKAADLATTKTGTAANEVVSVVNNLLAYVEWTNGASSSNYLATRIRNGILSKEDKIKLDYSPVQNGWFNGLRPGSSGQSLSKSSTISSVVSNQNVSVGVIFTVYRVTLVNDVIDPATGEPTSNYFVSFDVQQNAGDNNLGDSPTISLPTLRVTDSKNFFVRLVTSYAVPAGMSYKMNFKISVQQ